MSSKDLLPAATRTIFKKVRRSLSASSKTSGEPDVLNLNTTNSQALVLAHQKEPISRPPSYTSIVPEPQSPDTKSPLTPEWVDLEEAPTTTPNAQNEVTEAQILEQATATFAPPPPGVELPRLPKPVLIPRVDPRPTLPFCRAWVPELENHAISKQELVSFIDGLNIMITPHQAIYIAQLTALGVGFIPWDGADGVSAAIEVLSVMASIAHSHKRTKNYLAKMNETYFHPRKLHVKTTSTKKMMKLLELDKKDPLIAPLTEETLPLSVQERCLKHLSQWTSELSFEDIPPPTPQTTMLARMAQWEIRHRIRKADKVAKWSRNRAWKKFQKGKKLKESKMERIRIKQLSWILVQNMDDWEATKAAKEAAKAEKKAKKEEKKRSSTWRTIIS